MFWVNRIVIKLGLLVLLLHSTYIHCNVFKHKNELDSRNPSETQRRFISDYILIEDDGDNENEADSEEENYLQNHDDVDQDDADDEYVDNDNGKKGFTANQKRDIIKGPSYTPNINDLIADSEIERENYDTEQMTASAGSKRKFIPADEEVAAAGNNTSVIQRFISRGNYLHINTNPSHTNSSIPEPDGVTKRAFHLSSAVKDSSPSKKTKVNDESSKEHEKAIISEALINLLYDWKGREPLSDDSNTANTHSFSSSDVESGNSEMDSYKTKDEIDAARTISKLRQASHTFSDTSKTAVATENDVLDTASTLDHDVSETEDVNKDSTTSLVENEESPGKEASRSISSHKNKGKISVMVNVNINERAARRSKVEGANKTVTQVNEPLTSGAGSGDSDEHEASGFLQKYGALKHLDGNSNVVDTYQSLTTNAKTQNTNWKESETSSGSGLISSFVSNLYSAPSLTSFHPKNSTLNIFAGPAYPNNHEMKILNVAATAVPYTEDDESSEATSKDTVLESGSGEAEDDISIHTHAKKIKPKKLNNIRPLISTVKNIAKEKKVPEGQPKTNNNSENDETVDAERGETPDNIFANKMAADREEKNNELEHNDMKTESLTQIKLSQTKEFNKAQEAEINSNSKTRKKDDKNLSKLLHESNKDYKEKFTKELPSASDDNDEDLSEATKILSNISEKKESVQPMNQRDNNNTLVNKSDTNKMKDPPKKTTQNESKLSSENSKEGIEIKSDNSKAPSAEDVRIEQLNEKQAPKSIPKEATVKKDTEDGGSSAVKDSQAPASATIYNEEQNEETLSKNELKIDADNSLSSEGKDNIKKMSSNDDKYETLEEVREKFKKWENHLKDKQSAATSEKEPIKTSVGEKVQSKSYSSESDNGKMNKKVTDNDVDVTDMTTPKQSSKSVKNENDIVDDNSNNKDEVNASSSEKKAKETQTKIADAVNKENTKNVVTDQEKDKEDQLKEIEEEKEEIERKTKSKSNSMKRGDEKTQDAQDTVKSWKEEEKILLAKLKNPFLDENSKLKKYKDEEEEEDNGDELKKLIRSKAAKKVKKVEKSKELIQKPKNQAKLKKERLQKTKKDTKKAVSNSKSKQDIGNVATSSKATDKELYAAVDSMFGGKAGKEKGAQDVQQKSAAVLKTPIPTSPLKGKLSEKNLKQLEKFKNQILSEVAKIDSLEKEYGKDSHSTKDLFEAKEVLQKDLKVVKELERSLLKNSAIQKPKKSVAQSQKSNKDNKKHQVSPPVKPVNADLETINSLTSSINSDLGVDKNPIDKLDSEEVIPEAKLGFDAVSEEEKEQDREEEKIADAEEVKLFKGSSSLAKGKTKSKSHDNAKGHSYEYAYYMGGKSTHEEEEDKKKKKQHPLEDIHALLKAEIKRLRVKKKDHKSDTQLANIRKLVQQRLKSMLASGELDKTAFHSLAPEIKELGQLLKHRIKNENQNLKKIGKSKKKGKSLKKAKKVKKMNPVGGKDLLNVQQGPESLPSGEANVIENIQQVGQASPEQPQSMPLKYKNQASQGDSESNVNEQQEPEGILPHLQGNSKEKIDADMAKDMQELDNSLSNQDVFSKIEKAHPEQSNKMKTLLTTLNQKLGEIYSKASKAQKPVSGAAAHMNLSPNHVPETPHQAQQVPQPPANIQPQQTQQEPHPQPPPITQQRQESPVPSLSHEQQSNVSMYQSQLASEASNTLPGIYPPQTFASPQSSALASPVVPQNSAGVVSTSYPQENAAVAPTNQAAEKSEPQNMYNLPAEGKNDLPSNNMQQPLSPTTEDFEFEDTAPQKALAGDEPVDTLVESLERDITEVWSYRDMFPDADSLGLDNEKVHNTYANLGSLSGLNLRRALKRALRGEDVGLAVVGGSISKGGPFSEKGLDYVLRSYFYAVEDYWNKIIRPVTGSSMIIRDVSIGGIATDYYSYCLQNHLPDDRLTNIVLWELSANDMRRYDEGLRPKPQPLEQFTRNVLSYRARPALIFVNFFALFDWDPDLSTHCRNYEDEGEDDVSRYYKITSLSWRNMVCPLLRAGTQPLFTRSRLFAEDNFHPSILGHAQMSYIIIDYIRTEFLKNLVKMRNTFIADAVTRLQIPKSIYIPRPMYPQTYLWKPLCHTYMLVDNRSPNNTLPLDEDHSSNFRYTVVREFKIRSDKIVGMETKQKDQFLRYRIHVPRHQNGGMEPYKRLGIMTFTDDRQAQIQYDAENPKNLDSRKKFLEGTLMKYVGENISPGEHELTIKSGSTGFLVCALVLG